MYAQVTQLFRGAPDLIDEFKMFLPDANATPGGVTPGSMPPTPFGGGGPMGGAGAGGTLGVMGVMGQGGMPPMSGQQTPGGDWGDGQKVDKSGTGVRRKAPADSAKDGPPKKRRKPAGGAEKEGASGRMERDGGSMAPGAGGQKIVSRVSGCMSASLGVLLFL